jgi:hypothetical protein
VNRQRIRLSPSRAEEKKEEGEEINEMVSHEEPFERQIRMSELQTSSNVNLIAISQRHEARQVNFYAKSQTNSKYYISRKGAKLTKLIQIRNSNPEIRNEFKERSVECSKDETRSFINLCVFPFASLRLCETFHKRSQPSAALPGMLA